MSSSAKHFSCCNGVQGHSDIVRLPSLNFHSPCSWYPTLSICCWFILFTSSYPLIFLFLLLFNPLLFSVELELYDNVTASTSLSLLHCMWVSVLSAVLPSWTCHSLMLKQLWTGIRRKKASREMSLFHTSSFWNYNLIPVWKWTVYIWNSFLKVKHSHGLLTWLLGHNWRFDEFVKYCRADHVFLFLLWAFERYNDYDHLRVAPKCAAVPHTKANLLPPEALQLPPLILLDNSASISWCICFSLVLCFPLF